MRTIKFLALAIPMTLLVAACAQTPGATEQADSSDTSVQEDSGKMMEDHSDSMMEDEGMMEDDSGAMMEEDGEGMMDDESGEMMEEDTEGMMDDEGMMEDDEGAMMEDHGDSMMEGDSAMSEPRIVEVTVENWAFTPSTITAKKGEKLIIRLTGTSGSHSFGVSSMGINVPISAGETKDVAIPTDTAGTFAFRCMVPCGEGHRDMVGTIVIEE